MKTATQLKKFRQQCERDAGVSAAHIKLPLLHVLNDLCQVHGISGKQRRRVIGDENVLLGQCLSVLLVQA